MSRKLFHLVCYLNKEDIDTIIFDYTTKSDLIEYAYIMHNAESEDKKDHWHVYLKFFNPKNASDISKKFNIHISICQPVKNRNSLLQYFCHYNVIDKIQYNYEEIITNINIKEIQSIFVTRDTLSDAEFIQRCCEFLDSGFNLRDLIKKCIQDNTIHLLRKYWSILKHYNYIEDYLRF